MSTSASQTLMVGVSGVRGIVGKDLTAEVVTRWSKAFGGWAGGGVVVLGRDSRESGPEFAKAAARGLAAAGCDVIDCGLVPTPTVQLAVEHHHAAGGIVVTASHNPVEWNALKFVGPDGIFLDVESGERVRRLVEEGDGGRGTRDGGGLRSDPDAVRRHVDQVLALPGLDRDRIRAAGITVALDPCRGAGGVIFPLLLKRLGCRMDAINLEADGRFPRPPEPLPEHLGELGALVRRCGAAVGMAVDPDADRLALVDETGAPIGEDYTLAFAVRAVLGGPTARPPVRPAVVVCNLSTSLVVEDAARECGASVVRTPVGEAHVARAMRAHGASVGGEGNGGVIHPALHLGRDAPVAAALVLHLLAGGGQSVSQWVAAAARYSIVKARAPRGGGPVARWYNALRAKFPDAAANTEDGVRLGWPDRWLHVRPSNTEPIVRVIAEAPARDAAQSLVDDCLRLLE